MTLFWMDPADKEDRGFDYSRWLAEDGDSIIGSQWTYTPPGLTFSDEIFSTTRTGVRISAQGTLPGSQFKVSNHIACLSGQEKDKSFYVTIADE